LTMTRFDLVFIHVEFILRVKYLSYRLITFL
jgi:hypothetical protein